MKTPSVPKLNLAPKRYRPLSLRNPLDYLQLLYWALFFPQATRWYFSSFSKKQGIAEHSTHIQWRGWRKESSTRRDFAIQGLSIAILIPLVIFLLILQQTDIETSFIGVVFSILVGPTLWNIWVEKDTAAAIAHSIMLSVSGGCIGGMLFSLVALDTTSLSVGIVVAGIISVGVAYGVSSMTYLGMLTTDGYVPTEESEGSKRNPPRLEFELTAFVLTIAAGSFILVLLTQEVGLTIVEVLGFAPLLLFVLSLSYYIGAFLAVCRLEVWLFTNLLRLFPKYREKVFGPSTALPLIGLSQQISSWLHIDWLSAIYNINELLTYTRQFFTVRDVIIKELKKLPPDIILLRISQLSEHLLNWKTLRDIAFIQHSSPKGPTTWKRREGEFAIAVSGFLYLHEGNCYKSAQTFESVENLDGGLEMKHLSICLHAASSAEQLNSNELIAALVLPDGPLLRPHSWAAIGQLRSVINDVQIVYRSYSNSAKSFALNRALGELDRLIESSNRIPRAERNVITSIAKNWQKKLLSVAVDVGKINLTGPIRNPYIAGDPVEGDLFIGRGKILKQLEELLSMSNQLQSVVLYGHRRMGKTSILKSLSNYLGNNIQVVYINLLNLGAVSEGAGEVLMTLSDAISQQFSISPPDDEALLRLPEVTFRRFIQTINQQLKKDQGLIIALDEFEKIEELILANKLSPDFLGFLRGLLQEHPKIAFAFAGLHTLEELTEDYFNPLFASVLPIRIGFFTLGETRQLLANPAEDFTLDYTPETLNEIYRLTAGQPYLTQLVGFQLVRHYNHQVFEENRERSPIFTPEDLTTVIHHSDFFAKGRYYFTGVWNQAEQDTPHQQVILKILSQKSEGYSTSDIRRQSKLSETEVTGALKTLQRHDVVTSTESKWKIIVPLFRQWVQDYQ